MAVYKQYVLPTQESARQFHTPLRGSDNGYLFVMDVPIAFVFPEHHLDEALLKAALARTLDEFPTASTRVVRENGHYLLSDLAFSGKGSQGVVFEHETIEGAMPDERAHAGAWSRYFCRTNFRMMGEPIGIPLLSARVTRFSAGGSVLCVNFAHVLTDGAALLAFMHMWSYFCGVLSENTQALPNQKPIVPVLHRAIEDLGARASQDASERKGLIHTARAGLRILWMNATDEVVDFQLSAAHLNTLKQTVSAQLPPGKWVSSYEVLMSYLLRALAQAEQKQALTCRAIVNIRGRAAVAPQGYFGNALTYHPFHFANQGEVADTALAFHDSLRAALTDEAGLARPHLAAERYLRRGRIRHLWDRSRWVKPFFTSVLDGEPVVNSWVGFDWFGVDFGLGGQAPSYLRVAPSFRNRRHIHVFPSSKDGQLMIRMQLSKRVMQRFREALVAYGLAQMVVEIARE